MPERNVRKICKGIADSISQNDLQSKIYDIFRECDASIDPVNIHACHRLKSNHWP